MYILCIVRRIDWYVTLYFDSFKSPLIFTFKFVDEFRWWAILISLTMRHVQIAQNCQKCHWTFWISWPCLESTWKMHSKEYNMPGGIGSFIHEIYVYFWNLRNKRTLLSKTWDKYSSQSKTNARVVSVMTTLKWV